MNLKKLLHKGIFVLLLFLAQTGYAQSLNKQVSVPGGSMTYQQLFTLIEIQGDMLFGYATADIDVTQEVVVAKGDVRINELLNSAFEGTDYTYTVSGRHILISIVPPPVDVDIEENIVSQPYVPTTPRLPVFAVKSNLLYDITTTMNLAIEVGLSPRWTLNVPFNYNPWRLDGNTRLRHWAVQPELRYWFCNRFDGWFVGAHGHYAEFNVGGLPNWFFISENMQLNRYQGYLYGAGASVGYSWILKKRWSLEATVGLGYAHLVFDKYPCAECGTSMGRQTKDYFGPTNIGLTLVFMIK